MQGDLEEPALQGRTGASDVLATQLLRDVPEKKPQRKKPGRPDSLDQREAEGLFHGERQRRTLAGSQVLLPFPQLIDIKMFRRNTATGLFGSGQIAMVIGVEPRPDKFHTPGFEV